MSAAVIAASYVASGFTDDFNRSNRDLAGDNGWTATQTSPATGEIEINTNRIRATTGQSGFPGSGSNTGSGLRHAVTFGNSNVVDVSFDVVAGTTINDYLIIVVAALTSGSPATITSGALFRMYVGFADNWIIQKITSSTTTTDHSPGTSPATTANTTQTIRMVLTRSTGVLTISKNGSTAYTSAAGDFSSLTGSDVYFQFARPYSTTNIEVDNVICV